MKRCRTPAAKAVEALEQLRERFSGQTTLVFATGPSLPGLWAGRRSDLPKIAVNDSWQIVRGADILYASDMKWYVYHKGVPGFRGGLKVCYGATPFDDVVCVQGSRKGARGYDPELGYVCHGSNSGHAAVHLAAQLGANPIVLVGFDMRLVNGKQHYFGKHPVQIRNASNYIAWCHNYRRLGQELAPHGIEILNATPGSALTCFRQVRLEDVLERKAA